MIALAVIFLVLGGIFVATSLFVTSLEAPGIQGIGLYLSLVAVVIAVLSLKPTEIGQSVSSNKSRRKPLKPIERDGIFICPSCQHRVEKKNGDCSFCKQPLDWRATNK